MKDKKEIVKFFLDDFNKNHVNKEGIDISKLCIGTLTFVDGEPIGMLFRNNLENNPEEKCLLTPILTTPHSGTTYLDIINETIIEEKLGFSSFGIIIKTGALVVSTEPLKNVLGDGRKTIEELRTFIKSLNEHKSQKNDKLEEISNIVNKTLSENKSLIFEMEKDDTRFCIDVKDRGVLIDRKIFPLNQEENLFSDIYESLISQEDKTIGLMMTHECYVGWSLIMYINEKVFLKFKPNSEKDAEWINKVYSEYESNDCKLVQRKDK